MSVEFKELYPLSLFKKAVKNDSLMPQPTIKHMLKLRIYVKYIAILAAFSRSSLLIFYYDKIRLLPLFAETIHLLLILDVFLYKYVVDIS